MRTLSGHRVALERYAQRALGEGRVGEMGTVTDIGTSKLLSVLIVDDDPDIRCLLADLLRAEADAVYQAPDGKPGLQRLREHPESLIVLLDINMPVMNGIEVLQAVFAEPPLAQRHAFIVMTAQYDSLPPTLTAMLADLQIPILRKPFHLASVLGAVAHARRRMEMATEINAPEHI